MKEEETLLEQDSRDITLILPNRTDLAGVMIRNIHFNYWKNNNLLFWAVNTVQYKYTYHLNMGRHQYTINFQCCGAGAGGAGIIWGPGAGTGAENK